MCTQWLVQDNYLLHNKIDYLLPPTACVHRESGLRLLLLSQAVLIIPGYESLHTCISLPSFTPLGFTGMQLHKPQAAGLEHTLF